MKIALIGYGRMGKEIEMIARERGHEISLIIDVDNACDLNPENLTGVDVAIEFTIPASAVGNYKTCFDAGVPVVSGTTGWLEQWDEVTLACKKRGVAFFYASNYSLGVNLFFELNRKLANLMKSFGQYKVRLTEVHHTKKLDAPSGTAISLAEDLIGIIPGLQEWTGAKTDNPASLPVVSIREGEVPGIHIVKYESDVDYIEIEHSAKSRKGFALGAVLAAEFTAGKQGILTMHDLLNIH
jgi:4-hydroxy-tetrahydrodipicolinate reductase